MFQKLLATTAAALAVTIATPSNAAGATKRTELPPESSVFTAPPSQMFGQGVAPPDETQLAPLFSGAFYLGWGIHSLKQDVMKREKIGAPPAQFFVGARATLMRYAFVDFAVDSMAPPDNATFRETTCELPDGKSCRTDYSQLSGVTLSAEAGLQLKLSVPLRFRAWQVGAMMGIGQRGVHLNRSTGLQYCVDCRSDALHINGGTFVSPQLLLGHIWARNGHAFTMGVLGKYDHFLNGDLVAALRVGLFLELS